MSETRQLNMREALAIGSLRKLTAAQLVSMFGDFLAIYAVFSVVSFRLHGSPAQVSGVMIAYMLPQVFAGPLAGVFIDRWNVKATMIASDLLRAVLAACLVYSSNIWQIYGVLMLLSTISAFFMPAQTIAIRTIVPMNGLMAANALMMQVMQITQIVTPGIAGLLISHMGAASCFWMDSASFLFSAAMISAIATGSKTSSVATKMSPVLADLTLGGRYIFTHGVLAITILSMAAGGFAVSCYTALNAVYVRDVLHGSTGLFGILGTLTGVGMILGTQGITRIGSRISKTSLITAGLCGIASGTMMLAALGATPIAAIATLVVGFAVALVIIPAQTLMQSETPAEMLGRVSGTLRSVLALVQIAGLVLSGSIAQAIGIRNAYGAVSILLALIASAELRITHRRKAALVTV
ncbi:MAG TPA: MFS transporter [Bryobacteraceae bacterium]|nr:MFS transporter [Bryobacteraceae bacterium]